MGFFVFADIHTEAVQAALAKHKEEKMALPMPTKRRSTYVPSPIETRTPPGRKRARNVPQGARSAGAEANLCSFSRRLVVRIRRRVVGAQAVVGDRAAFGQRQPAQSGRVDQPHLSGLLHLLLCLIHAVPRRGQASASAPAAVQAAVPAPVPASASAPASAPAPAPTPLSAARAASNCSSDQHAVSESHW